MSKTCRYYSLGCIPTVRPLPCHCPTHAPAQVASAFLAMSFFSCPDASKPAPIHPEHSCKDRHPCPIPLTHRLWRTSTPLFTCFITAHCTRLVLAALPSCAVPALSLIKDQTESITYFFSVQTSRFKLSHVFPTQLFHEAYNLLLCSVASSHFPVCLFPCIASRLPARLEAP